MNKFEPLHKKHGIASALVVMLLKKPITGPDQIGQKLIESQTVLTKFEQSKQIKIENIADKTTQTTSVNGFILSEREGKRSLHGFNDGVRNVLVYTENDYTRWDSFLSCLQPVLKSLSEILDSNELVALALEYNDVFDWQGEPNAFKWNELFKEDTGMLSADFHEHTHLKFEVIRNRTSHNKNEIVEQLSIARQTDKSAVIKHHVSIPCDGSITTQKLSSEVFNDKLNELHEFNKDVLRNLLTNEMAKRVNLI
jgi:uncharacterized protein (TIGR04255 family)